MSDTTNPGLPSTPDKGQTPLPEKNLEAWKHFAGAGATDKNTMVTVVSGGLTLLAGLIGYTGSHWNELHRLRPALWLGLGGSMIIGYVALLYGGYANRNWAKADTVAPWDDLKTSAPPTAKAERGRVLNIYAHVNCFAWWLATPCEPTKRLPPIFWLYAGAAMSFGGIFVYYLVQAC